jgi:3-methyl-2-oxobutanoate hydroxymethyltransferase
VNSLDEARAVEAAGVDMMVVGDDLMDDAIRAVAPTTFMIAALAYGNHATTEEYLRAAFAMHRFGADAVYCAASLQTISRLSAEGIPVVGHIGFIPTHATWTGGFKAVGKTTESALGVWRQALELQSAGAFAAEIEIVPEAVATSISERTSLFLISMGSGSGCDAQYLFGIDVLGYNDGHYPRHSKTYRDFSAEHERLQAERVAAFTEFRDDVEAGRFPGPDRTLEIDDEELAGFLRAIDGSES